jgi:polysaccharide pyruvyl transferase WcaK-like protein
VKILVDQSGYELLNIGDVAMLQSCIMRLKHQWPDAEIMVISHAPGQLESQYTNVITIGRTFADQSLIRQLPRKPRLASEQAWKMTGPYLSGRLRARSAQDRPRSAIQAVHVADVVVASGGGYVTDTWWWHAAGVLSLLSLAQRLGKPTAMFGQGIGPIRQRALRAQAATVLPNLKILGLREDRMGRGLALDLGVRPDAITLTGDDALELIDDKNVSVGNALGINVRVSGYAGVDSALAATIGGLVLRVASTLQAPIVGLPVSRQAVDADVAALRALFGDARNRPDIILNDIASPEGLVSAAAGCRAIVTGSYHTAVFGLSQGVPTVCLTKSSYYQGKFGGLQAQFPHACFVIPLDEPDYAERMERAIFQAWHLPTQARVAAHGTAAQLRNAGREAYTRFRLGIERRTLVTTDSRGLAT